MSGLITIAASESEIAAWLVSQGVFNDLSAAYAAAPYWQTEFIAHAQSVGIKMATAPLVQGGAATPIVSTTETALELANGANLGATDLVVKSSGTSIVKAGSTGTQYGFSTILGVDLGIVGAVAAPILGVAIGYGMYESNPELWTKISQKLLPFCYPDTTVIPTWAEIVDGAWQTSIAKEIVDALQELFDEEGIPTVSNPAEKWAGSDLIPGVEFPYLSNPVTTGGSVWHDTGWMWNQGTEVHAVRIDTGSFSYTYDGKTVYYEHPYLLGNNVAEAPTGYYDAGKVAWTAKYGTVVERGYQEGTSKWTGTVPSTVPTVPPAIADEQGTEIPRTPVSLPYSLPEGWQPGQPANSPDPSEQPDPTVTTDPAKQVSPYIMPTPTPREITYPDPEPVNQPELNPSQNRPASKSVTLPPSIADFLEPPPSGISPTPLMPSTELPFASNVGLVTVYHPDNSQLYSFQRWLWVTYADATIDKIWNNPFDGVITLFELYCTPTDVGNRNIHCGFLDSGINTPIISRYTEIDCGTLGIPEYYGNYLDYSPYTKAHIYLPFIGVQELNPDDIVGHCVNVTYRIDEYNGSCIAMITVAKVTEVAGEQVEYSNTMYQFSGNCSVELPLAGGTQASIRAGMMMADAQQIAGAISVGANLLGAAGSAMSGQIGGAVGGVGNAVNAYGQSAVQRLNSMLSGKSTVQKSGTFGSSHGALGIKKPFITITRPKQVRVQDYNELYGYPAHKMVTIGSLSGFVRCKEVHVVSPTANDEEKSLIEQLLKSGVYME